MAVNPVASDSLIPVKVVMEQLAEWKINHVLPAERGFFGRTGQNSIKTDSLRLALPSKTF